MNNIIDATEQEDKKAAEKFYAEKKADLTQKVN